jgi:hypothetical protein
MVCWCKEETIGWVRFDAFYSNILTDLAAEGPPLSSTSGETHPKLSRQGQKETYIVRQGFTGFARDLHNGCVIFFAGH